MESKIAKVEAIDERIGTIFEDAYEATLNDYLELFNAPEDIDLENETVAELVFGSAFGSDRNNIQKKVIEWFLLPIKEAKSDDWKTAIAVTNLMSEMLNKAEEQTKE